MSKAIAIIVAAGKGMRAGGNETGLPKQFEQVLGKPVVQWSAEAFRAHPDVGEIIVVAPPRGAPLPDYLPDICDKVIHGAGLRADSVRAGLEAATGVDDTPVLIHDAARPGLTVQMITQLLEALKKTDVIAAAPAHKPVDALKAVPSKGALKALGAEQIYAVQTPQAFHLGTIRSALSDNGSAHRDELAAVEHIDGRVELVGGETRLMKITYEQDFETMAKLLAPIAAAPRIGTGYDVHKFGAGEFVTLCGVQVPHSRGLVGHSDADVAWHALTDAILGAIAMGDIGDHFPPSDPQWVDADSGLFLSHAAKLATGAGYRVSHADMTLICESPKIKPHREAMRKRTAEILELGPESVSVKATTTEGLGFTGRSEGMAAQASVVLMPL